MEITLYEKTLNDPIIGKFKIEVKQDDENKWCGIRLYHSYTDEEKCSWEPIKYNNINFAKKTINFEKHKFFGNYKENKNKFINIKLEDNFEEFISIFIKARDEYENYNLVKKFEYEKPYGKLSVYCYKDGSTYYKIGDESTSRCYVSKKQGGISLSDSRTLKIDGKSVKAGGFKIENIEELDALINEINTENRVEKQNKLNAEIEKIKNDEQKFSLTYHDGEYLSGYASHGNAQEIVLSSLKIGRYVDGWGYYVPDNVLAEIGAATNSKEIEFCYSDAKKIYDKKMKIINEKKAEKQAAIDAIFKKARETGTPQVLESYATGCNDPREECSTDIITIYANPDGSKSETRSHTW